MTKHRVFVDDAYLKEFQRLSYGQFTVFRLLYQTPWVFSVSILIPIVLVVFLISFKYWLAASVLAVILSISLSVRYARNRALRRARERSPFIGENVEFILGDRGFDTFAPDRSAHVDWPGLTRAIVYGNGVLLETTPRNFSWLPDKSLTEGSPAELRRLLTDRLEMRVVKAGFQRP